MKDKIIKTQKFQGNFTLVKTSRLSRGKKPIESSYSGCIVYLDLMAGPNYWTGFKYWEIKVDELNLELRYQGGNRPNSGLIVLSPSDWTLRIKFGNMSCGGKMYDLKRNNLEITFMYRSHAGGFYSYKDSSAIIEVSNVENYL